MFPHLISKRLSGIQDRKQNRSENTTKLLLLNNYYYYFLLSTSMVNCWDTNVKKRSEMMKELKMDLEEVVEKEPLHGLRFVMCSSVHSRCTVN